MSADRLAALALVVSMLHLNFVRADSVCATHADHARQPVPSHQGMSGHHASGHHTSSEAPADTCETPIQPDCCQALASCSLVLGSDDAQNVASVALDHDRMTTVAAQVPQSRIVAPDPPPPRR